MSQSVESKIKSGADKARDAYRKTQEEFQDALSDTRVPEAMRALAEKNQWRNVWGTIRNFRYDPERIEAIVSPDRLMAVGMGVWQSDGFHPNGERFDRPGRTTVTLARETVGDPFIATHTHMSLFRGTPDRSFGNFG